MTQLLQNAVYGTAMILVVMALRRALKDRLAPGARLALWAVCLFRLLTPNPPESVLSLWGLVRRVAAPEAGTADAPAFAPVPSVPESGFAPAAGAPAAPAAGAAPAVAPAAEAAIPWGTVLMTAWVLVGIAVGLWYAAGWLRTRRAVGCAVPVGRDDPRYGFLPKSARLREGLMDGAPLTFGAVRPTVVLSPGLSGEELVCVLAHEGVHASRRDNLWHYAAAVALAAHWWNPAVWVMARLLRQDIELSCDRAALKKLGADRRADYARALVSLSTQAEGPAFCQTFGRKATEERILSIMKFKKMTVLGVVLTLALVLGVTIGFASDPVDSDGADSPAPVADDTPENTREPYGIIGSRFYDYQFVEGGDAAVGVNATVNLGEGQTAPDLTGIPAQDGGHYMTTGYDEHGNLTVTGVRTPDGTIPLCDDEDCEAGEAHYHNEDGAACYVEYQVPGLLCTRTDCKEGGQHQHDGVVYSARTATLTPEEYAAALDCWVELDAMGREEADQWLDIFRTCYDRVQRGECDAFRYNICNGAGMSSVWYVSDRAAGVYPVNSKGETYGPDMPEIYGGSPDLVLAQGTNGEEGYIRESETSHYGYPGTVNNPEEAMAYMAWLETQPSEKMFPLYDCEGNVIGQFRMTHTVTEGPAPQVVPGFAGIPVCHVDGCTAEGQHTHNGEIYCGGAGHHGDTCDGNCIYCVQAAQEPANTSGHHSEDHHSSHH